MDSFEIFTFRNPHARDYEEKPTAYRDMVDSFETFVNLHARNDDNELPTADQELRHVRGDVRRAPARERGAPARKVFRHMGCFGTGERCSGTRERCSGTRARCSGARSAPARQAVLRHKRGVSVRDVLWHEGWVSAQERRRAKRDMDSFEPFTVRNLHARDNDVIMGGYGTVGTRHSGV